MSWQNLSHSTENAGGFMDASMNDDPGAADKGNIKRGQNSMPVMISHLQNHGEKLTVWGIPARIVTFVAIVRSIDSTSTKISFEFQDETGSIKGIKWLEGDNVTAYESPVTINAYARIFGLIRDQNNEPYVLIVNIQPINHVNELLTHLMEVTLMCLQGEKMINKVAADDVSFANNSIQNSTMDNGSMTTGSGLTKNQQTVLEIIKNGDSEYGAERITIKQRVPSLPASEVDKIIEFLSGEGHIYTTKTDDFFKAI